MRKALVALLGAALIVWPVWSQWTRVEVSGESVCRNSETGEVYNDPKYNAKSQVSIVCTVLNNLGWGGVAAQPASVIPVALSSVTGGTVGRLDYNYTGAFPNEDNDVYSDDDSDPETETLFLANGFDSDYLKLVSIRTESGDSTTTGATTRVSFTPNVPGTPCALLDDALVGNEPPWLSSLSYVDQGDDFTVIKEGTLYTFSRYCPNSTVPKNVAVELGGNCAADCGSALMYFVFFIPEYLPVGFANPTTPTVPVRGAVSFNPTSFQAIEGTLLTFTAERTGGIDGACAVSVAEGTAASSITLNTSSLTWADQEGGSKTGTVLLGSVSSNTDATLTLSSPVGCALGTTITLPIQILDTAASCGANGCVRFGIDTISVDESSGLLTTALRIIREASDPLTSLAASATVYISGGTCPSSVYTFSETPATWSAGEEGNRHTSVTINATTATCTIIFSLKDLSNLTLNSTLTTKTMTVNEIGSGGGGSASCNFWASTGGSAGNPGTIAQPWTLTKANSTLTAGSTVCLRAGTYAEQINPVNSGTATLPITYMNYNGETVNVAGFTDASDTPAAVITTNYVTLDGLRIFKTSPAQGNSQFYQSEIYITGSNNTIKNSVIVNPRSQPLDFANGVSSFAVTIDGSDNLIYNNAITGTAWGVRVNANSGALRNIIRGNTFTDVVYNAVDLTTSFGVEQGTLIEDNIITGSLFSDGVQSNGNFALGSGIATDASACGIIIRNNLITFNAENGIDMKGGCKVVIEGNTIYGNKGDNDGTFSVNGSWTGAISDPADRQGGSGINQGSGTSSNHFIVRNNLIYDNFGGSRNSAAWHVYNNTICGNRRDYTGANSSGTATAGGFYDISSNQGAGRNNIICDNNWELLNITSSSWDYNLYYNSFQTPRFGWRNDPTIYTLAQWIATQSAGDDHSTIANPLFVNVPSGFSYATPGLDFHLTASSPARNTGVALTTAVGAGSSSTTLTVLDARYFYDGFGVTTGDRIRIAGGSPITITDVSYGLNGITLATPASWSNGAAITLDYDGSAPDMGALEYDE